MITFLRRRERHPSVPPGTPRPEERPVVAVGAACTCDHEMPRPMLRRPALGVDTVPRPWGPGADLLDAEFDPCGAGPIPAGGAR